LAKTTLFAALALASAVSSARAEPALNLQEYPAPATAHLSVCFTPQQSCAPVLLHEIETAKKEILVHGHNFTNRAIMKALVQAKRRGVDVRVILKAPHQDRQSRALKTLAAGGIPVFIDRPAGVAHNKVMIFDRRAVTTGSYNFTYAADRKNAENLLLIEDYPSLVEAYVKNWESRLAASKPAIVGPGAANDNEPDNDNDDN
jgi:phosphatidylserine/phosphatidylglycerophosphate/cardiolipin synthase-like enzyme